MTTEALLLEPGEEVCELSLETSWTCSCGATTVRNGRIPNNAPEVCEHAHAAARRLPVAEPNRLILAAREAAGGAPPRQIRQH